MKKIKNIILFIIILFLPVLIFGICIYFYYPSDIEYGKKLLVLKYPLLNKIIHVKNSNNTEPIDDNTQINTEKKTTSEKTETPFNQEFYSALCQSDEKKSEITPFIGCDSCPSYLDTENKNQKLIYKYFFRGNFIDSNENEAVFFFTGCQPQKTEKMLLVILRKTLGEWKQYKNFLMDFFEKKPLIFKSKDTTALFVTKTTQIKGPKINENMIFFKIKENEIQIKSLFNAQYNKGIQCSNDLGVTISEPTLTKIGLSFDMDFIEQFKSDTLCDTITESPKKFYLEPNKYTLNYEYKGDSIEPDDKTLFILNKLDKSIEGTP